MVDGFTVNKMSQTFTLPLGFSHIVATKMRGKWVQSCFLFLPMALSMSARLANGSKWMTDVELLVTISLHARLSRKSAQMKLHPLNVSLERKNYSLIIACDRAGLGQGHSPRFSNTVWAFFGGAAMGFNVFIIGRICPQQTSSFV